MQVIRISIQDYKAVQQQEISLSGKSMYLIGANGTGKSTVGNVVATLLTKNRPGKPLREGATDGFAEVELSSGHIVRWAFDASTDKLTVIAPDGTVEKSPAKLLKAMAGEGMSFDINEFMQLQPAEQKKALVKILGLEGQLAELEARYKLAYATRTDANAATKAQAARVQPFDPALLNTPRVDVAALAAKIDEAYAFNRKIQDTHAKLEQRKEELEAYTKHVAKYEADVAAYKNPYPVKFLEHIVSLQNSIKGENETQRRALRIIEDIIDNSNDFDGEYEQCVALLAEYKSKMEAAAEKVAIGRDYVAKLPPPIADEVIAGYRDQIAKAEATNAAIDAAHRMHQEEQALAVLQEQAAAADAAVKAIEAERVALLQANPLPAEGMTLGENGLLLNGLPFTDQQICTSAKMIAAIQIAMSMLGTVRFLHFDASILDRKNAEKLLAWAEANGLQLALERADWDGGELRYEILP